MTALLRFGLPPLSGVWSYKIFDFVMMIITMIMSVRLMIMMKVIISMIMRVRVMRMMVMIQLYSIG